MELELSKKDYEDYVKNIPNYINSLKQKVEEKNKNIVFDYSYECIEIVEKYFSNISEMNSEDIKEFWSYIGEALRFYVGGEYKLAPKSEDVAFTPIIINYGYKEKWKIRLSPEVWRDKLIRKKLNSSLSDNIKDLNKKYGNEK